MRSWPEAKLRKKYKLLSWPLSQVCYLQVKLSTNEEGFFYNKWTIFY